MGADDGPALPRLLHRQCDAVLVGRGFDNLRSGGYFDPITTQTGHQYVNEFRVLAAEWERPSRPP